MKTLKKYSPFEYEIHKAQRDIWETPLMYVVCGVLVAVVFFVSLFF